MAKKNPVRAFKLSTQVKRQRQSKTKKALNDYMKMSRHLNPSKIPSESGFKKEVSKKSENELQRFFRQMDLTQKNIEGKKELTPDDYEALNRLTRLKIILLNEMSRQQQAKGVKLNPGKTIKLTSTMSMMMQPYKKFSRDLKSVAEMSDKGAPIPADLLVKARRDLLRGAYMVQNMDEREQMEDVADALHRLLLAHGVSVSNPKKKSTKKKIASKSKAKLAKPKIDECRRLWNAYCKSPGKMKLRAVEKCCEEMKSYPQKSVKDERKRCMNAIAIEKRHLKKKG